MEIAITIIVGVVMFALGYWHGNNEGDAEKDRIIADLEQELDVAVDHMRHLNEKIEKQRFDMLKLVESAYTRGAKDGKAKKAV